MRNASRHKSADHGSKAHSESLVALAIQNSTLAKNAVLHPDSVELLALGGWSIDKIVYLPKQLLIKHSESAFPPSSEPPTR